MKRRLPGATCLTGAALLALLAAGCTNASGLAPPSGLEKTNLTVGAVPVADEVGLYIAKDEHLFQDVGLNVTIDSIISSADATTGQNNGTYDITAGNSVSYIQDQVSHQSNLEIVAEGSLMEPDNQALYALPGSRIATLANIRGARIGVNALNNIGTLLISSVLQGNGIPPSEVHFVVIKAGFPGMAQALEQHAIDVAWLPEPFGSADSLKYGLQEIADLDQGATTSFPVGWYVVTKTWARKYPHTLTAFLSALQQGQEIADTDRAAVERAMQELPEPYRVPASITAIMTLESYPLNIAPNIDASRVQRVADAMFQAKMLPAPFQVSSMLQP